LPSPLVRASFASIRRPTPPVLPHSREASSEWARYTPVSEGEPHRRLCNYHIPVRLNLAQDGFFLQCSAVPDSIIIKIIHAQIRAGDGVSGEDSRQPVPWPHTPPRTLREASHRRLSVRRALSEQRSAALVASRRVSCEVRRRVVTTAECSPGLRAALRAPLQRYHPHQVRRPARPALLARQRHGRPPPAA
jgi:hypothetical protein